MSNRVSIPISADASSAIHEMDRFVSAIRRAGQEGRKFADLDFSHPELKAFQGEMIEAQRRFDEIVRRAPGQTAQELRNGVKSGAYRDITSWWEKVPERFPDPEQREAHIARVTNGIFHGTPAQPVVHTPGGEGNAGEPGTVEPTNPAPKDPRKPGAKPTKVEPQERPEPAKVDPHSPHGGESVIEQAGAGAQMRWTLPQLDRFVSAIRRAGQEGRKFADLDFSHPELKAFQEEMVEAQRRFDEMVRSGRSEASRELRAGVRRGQYDDVVGWYKSLPRQFKNDALRARHMEGVSRNVFPGQQPIPENESGGGIPLIGGGIGSILRWALPLMGLAKVGSMAAEGISSATAEAVEVSALRRSMGALSSDFEVFRAQVRLAGDGLGVTYQETAALAKAFTRAAGETDERAAFGGTREAIGFARSTGLDPSQVVGRFGRAQWLQAAGRDTDPRELARLFADAIAGGGMYSRADQVMQAITNWVESSERVMVDSPNTRAYATTQAAMNASNSPGLRGEAGAAMLGQMDAAIRTGGQAGEAGQNFLYRVLSGVGVRDPFDVQYQLEEGAFAKLNDGRTMLEAVQAQLKQQYANPMMRYSAGARLLGLSMHQYQAFENLDPKQLGDVSKTIKRLGLEKSVSASGILDLAKLQGMNDTGLAAYRDHLLEARGSELTSEQTRSIQGAGNSGELRDALQKVVAQIGMEKDTGRRLQDATVEIKNQVTRLADGALPMLSDIKDILAEGFGLANDVGDDVADVIQADDPVSRDKAAAKLFGRLADATRVDVPKGSSWFEQVWANLEGNTAGWLTYPLRNMEKSFSDSAAELAAKEAAGDAVRRASLLHRRDSGEVELRNGRIKAFNEALRHRIPSGEAPAGQAPRIHDQEPSIVRGQVDVNLTVRGGKGEVIERRAETATLRRERRANPAR